MRRMRLLAAAAIAAVVLLAGGSATAGSSAGQAPTRGACLSDVTSLVAVVAPAKGKLGKVIAPQATGSLELKNALGTAITCADQAEKALEAPMLKVPVQVKKHLSPGVPRCARE